MPKPRSSVVYFPELASEAQMPKVSLAGRPIGVVILSGLAFAASPAMVPFLVDSRLAVLSRMSSIHLSRPGLFHLSVCSFNSMVSVLLGVRLESFMAGLDFSKRKNRGRQLATAAMILFLLPGIAFLLVRETWGRVSGVALRAFALFYLVYLQLPSIRWRSVSPSCTSN